ncbi:MAG TPA: methyltransferase domain-containing protein [Gaiellales bacterium]
METADRWARWLQERRYGSDPDWKAKTLVWLEPVRDRVIELAAIEPGDTLLDVGAGEGMIGFAALDRVGEHGRVVFSDVSEDLLRSCENVAGSLGVADRCEFVAASASRLDGVASSSVDVVTTRSVLIYLEDKAAALREFFRVLRPGGRIALFEPINSFGYPEPQNRLWGYDVTDIRDLAARVRAVLDESQARAGALTMTDFDERDLLAWTESAGFSTISLHHEVTIAPRAGLQGISWDAFVAFSPNPLCPTVEEAMTRALSPHERRRFESHLRPRVENEEGTNRGATVYLAATKTAAGATRATGS